MQPYAALKAARQGLDLNPNCLKSLTSMAEAYVSLSLWKNAEATSRRILDLDSANALVLNLLALSLRKQGLRKESHQIVDQLLARYPDDPFTLTNAGHDFLAAGNHLRARENFLHALRIDPAFELARQGLLQSLRARIWIIRWNALIVRFLSGFMRSPYSQLYIAGAVGLATLIGYGSRYLDNFTPHLGFDIIGSLILLLMLYLLLTGIVGVLANFFLLFDPQARQSLNRHEKILACIPTVPFILLFILLLISRSYTIALGLLLFFALLILLFVPSRIKDLSPGRNPSDP